MPKRVKILKRTVMYGDRMLGQGGEYTVTDVFAKKGVVDGHLTVVEDLGEDETSHIEVRDSVFLEKIRSHAKDIIRILEEASPKLAISIEPSIIEESDHNLSTDVNPSENVSSSDDLGSLETAVGNSQHVLSDNKNDAIPVDFPGLKELEKKGISSMSELKSLGYDDLIEKGIRQGLANQIGARLALMEK